MIRLIAALVSLGFAMAGPAAAAQAMAVRLAVPAMVAAPMPCHEAAQAGATHGDAGPAGLPAHRAGAALGHLCCVLTCLVVPPLAAAQPFLRLAVPAAHDPRPAPPLTGASLARPDPPPRGA